MNEKEDLRIFIENLLKEKKDNNINDISIIIRNKKNRLEIIRSSFDILEKHPQILIDIIYDMEEYQNELIDILNNTGIKLTNEQIEQIIKNEKNGIDIIYNNYNLFVNKNELFIITALVNEALLNNREDIINSLAYNKNLHLRALFIKTIITNHAELLSTLYDDITIT